MKKSTGIVYGFICFLIGVITGFLLAPANNGIGNNHSNVNSFKDDREDEFLKEEE